eukprot:10223066-Ditylum_brightwellii.AAC.1
MVGKGAMFSTSTKQKLNTRSLTEAELVRVNGIMPQVLWKNYFLEAQGMRLVPRESVAIRAFFSCRAM